MWTVRSEFFLFKLRHLITVWASVALTITDEVKNLNSCSYWGRDLHELNLNKNYLELKKKKSSGRPSGNKLESLEKNHHRQHLPLCSSSAEDSGIILTAPLTSAVSPPHSNSHSVITETAPTFRWSSIRRTFDHRVTAEKLPSSRFASRGPTRLRRRICNEEKSCLCFDVFHPAAQREDGIIQRPSSPCGPSVARS